MIYLGDYIEDDTVYLVFNTFSSDDPSASCTITNFVNTDVHIHKDDGTTQRNNAAGITVSVDFDGITGSHMIKIDTNDNTVAGFWVAGHDYFVRIEGTTVDAATINAMVGSFSIENRFMRGTDSAALATTALTNATWTDAKATFLDHTISTIDTVVDGIQTDLSNATDGLGALKAGIDAIPTTAMRGTDNAALAATALADTTWTDAKAAFLDHSITTVDTVVDGIQTDLSNATDGLGALKAGIDAIPTTAMRGTDGVSLVVPDASGTAAGLHTTTDGLITTVDTVVDGIAVDVTAIDVLTEAGGSGDLAGIKTQVDAILDLERESGVVSVTNVETTLYEDAAPTKNKSGIVVKIDMAALASGDTFVVKEKYKDESGGAYQEVDEVTYSGAQGKPLRIVALTPYRYGAIITMQRTAGSDRSIEWESFVGE